GGGGGAFRGGEGRCVGAARRVLGQRFERSDCQSVRRVDAGRERGRADPPRRGSARFRVSIGIGRVSIGIGRVSRVSIGRIVARWRRFGLELVRGGCSSAGARLRPAVRGLPRWTRALLRVRRRRRKGSPAFQCPAGLPLDSLDPLRRHSRRRPAAKLRQPFRSVRGRRGGCAFPAASATPGVCSAPGAGRTV
ncbi:hypothetical protein T484DRAFT_1918479, partial [Baffinella frigidus]